MTKYILELSINNEIVTREIEADGAAIQDGSKSFLVFYKVTGINENGEEARKTLISYNLSYVLSLSPEDDTQT